MRSIALWRGINVGTAKQVAMTDLAAVFRGLGLTEVSTVLRSGNVVFSHDAALPAGFADDLERALAAATGVPPVLLDAPTLREVMAANPLLDVGTDHSRLVVASSPGRPTRDGPTCGLAPERLVVGSGRSTSGARTGSRRARCRRRSGGRWPRG